MKKMTWRILMAVTMVIILLAGMSLAESESWDCPQCGRKGNTRNFCGGCGHARPEDGAINASNFPDENFRKYVSDHFDTDHDETLSDSERNSVIEIDCSESSISDLKGIEYFTQLTNLNCAGNQLSNVDVRKNTQLTFFNCGGNKLTSLDVSQNTQLAALVCAGNQLTRLDIGENAQLTDLWCEYNQLTSLDVSNNPQLTSLECSDNQLSSLDVRKNTQLTYFNCGGNKLTSLDISNNPQLTTFWCSNNQLTRLDVGKNTQLSWLECNLNQLHELDISGCPPLIEVYRRGNYTDQDGMYHYLGTDSDTRIITGE